MFDPEALLERLVDAGVNFVVIGGVAVGFHGVVRGTKDLDICPQTGAENLKRLASLRVELEATHAASADFDPAELPGDPSDPAQLAGGGNFRLTTSLGALDIMQWLPGIDEDHAHAALDAEAAEIEWRRRRLRICSLEHLRQMKHAARRPQDLQDLRDLDAAHGVEPSGQ